MPNWPAAPTMRLHLGLTEAGMGTKGIVASSAAMGILLQQGIGDTIRVSLTPEPGGDRTREVVVAQELLQVMGFRQFVPVVAACPGLRPHHLDRVPGARPAPSRTICGATCRSGAINTPASRPLKVAVMGCIVNGPGESKHADIGISLPGTGESPAAPVFIDGKKAATLRGAENRRGFPGHGRRLHRKPVRRPAPSGSRRDVGEHMEGRVQTVSLAAGGDYATSVSVCAPGNQRSIIAPSFSGEIGFAR
jgi:hypothetical protein